MPAMMLMRVHYYTNELHVMTVCCLQDTLALLFDPESFLGTYSYQADEAKFDALIGEHLFYIELYTLYPLSWVLCPVY